ncbi:sodium/solute symporter [Candidatus Poribacteria bacterium]|nr:sodium/solute symporter [Candidatus Poribacteria bacterium]
MNPAAASVPPTSGLAAIDFAVLALVVGAMLLVGWWAGRGESSTSGFFLGGRRIPGWAACLSFVATEVSAMTIIGVPADSFRSNWNYAQFFIGSALARVVVAYLFIPAFYEVRCTTIYEFLRNRFGAGTQYCATGFFFVTRLLASGVRLYIAALAVAAILGMPLWASVLAFTLIPILFIGWGGMRAVIWTSVMQALVFLGAGWVVLAFLHFGMDGGLAAMFGSAFPVGADAAARAASSALPAAQAVFTSAAESGSRVAYFFNFAWDTGGYPAGSVMGVLHGIFASPTALWIGIVAGFFMSLASFGTDQENVQRLLTVETRRESQRMILWTILVGGLVLLTYLAIGSGLAAWFIAHPELALPEATDKIFPHFIATVLPHGLRGLLLAAIILASIDSPLVSLATSAVTDLYKPLVRPGESDAHYLGLSRVLVAGFGVILGGLAMFFSQFDGILWVAFKIGGITVGSLLGVFLYGLMFKGTARRAPIVAMIVNAVVMAVLLVLSELKFIWLAWSWLAIFGTVLTMTLTRLLAGVLGEHEVSAPAGAVTA